MTHGDEPQRPDHTQLGDRSTWFEALAEQSMDGITVADNDGRYVYVNSAFCGLTGYSRPELLTMSVFDLVQPGTKVKLLSIVVAGGRAVRRGVLVRKDGTPVHVEVSGSALQLKDSFVMGTVRDITERKLVEDRRAEELRRLQAEMERVASLPGFVTVCANCKDVKRSSSEWCRIESYLGEYFTVRFSHGICPVCVEKLYGSLAEIEGNAL